VAVGEVDINEKDSRILAIIHYVDHNMYIPHKPACRGDSEYVRRTNRMRSFIIYGLIQSYRPRHVLTDCLSSGRLVHAVLQYFILHIYKQWGTAVAQWLRRCATNRKVAGSIPAGVIEIFH